MAIADFRAQVLLADYVAVDAAGKTTAVGLGFQIVGVDPNTGTTPPQVVAAVIDVAPSRLRQEFPVVLELRHVDGTVVQVPGVSGAAEALRVQQLVRADAPALNGVYLPSTLWGRVQTVISFGNGIPLKSGESYYWRLEVDHRHARGWEAHFHVAGPPPAPTFGGPVAPTDIPNVVAPVSDVDDDEDGDR